MKPAVLFIKGVRDDRTVKVLSVDNDNIVFNVGGSSNIYRFIDNDQFDKAILTLDAKPSSSINTLGCRVMFNQISDFDTYRISLNKVSDMQKQLDGVICINRPEQIALATRDSVSRLLQDIDGLTVPCTVRIAPVSPEEIASAIHQSDLEFPVLIRECGRHGGDRTQLLQSKEEIDRLYSFALDGRDFYLTAYHDFAENTADGDAVYKKYRIAVIDGRPYIRHLIISDDWMIHSDSRRFMEQHEHHQEEETRALETFDSTIAPLIQPIISEMQQRFQLEYFGIDCNISAHGKMLLFEANATMNILLNNAETPNKWQQPITKIKQALIEMIMRRVKSTRTGR